MQEWLKIALILSGFGFFKELRPSEPFLFEYLTEPRWNLTAKEVTQEITPIVTYSYLASLVVVFFVTDLCRYKPIMITSGITSVIVYSLQSWGTTKWQVQLINVGSGIILAADVAYMTYCYAKVSKEYYSKVTAITRSAALAGYCVSSLLSQMLILFKVTDYRSLNYISFGGSIIALTWSVLLPSVPVSVYFHQLPDKKPIDKKSQFKSAIILMQSHFVKSFSNTYVLKWSIWWAFTTAGFMQIQQYSQALWNDIHGGSSKVLHNGTVETLLMLVGCLSSLSVGYLKINWEKMGEVLLAFCAILIGFLTTLSSQTDYLYVSYVCYISVGGLFYFMSIVSTSEIAKHILEDSYGLIFSVNAMVSVLLQTLLTFCFVNGAIGWSLMPRQQFLMYGIYYIAIALLFLTIALISKCRNAFITKPEKS